MVLGGIYDKEAKQTSTILGNRKCHIGELKGQKWPGHEAGTLKLIAAIDGSIHGCSMHRWIDRHHGFTLQLASSSIVAIMDQYR